MDELLAELLSELCNYDLIMYLFLEIACFEHATAMSHHIGEDDSL